MCKRDNQVIRFYTSIRREPTVKHPALRNPIPTRRTFAEWEASMAPEPPSAGKLSRIQASQAFPDESAPMKQRDPWPAGYFENPRPAPVPPPRRETALQSSEAGRRIQKPFSDAGARTKKSAARSDATTQVDKPLPLLPTQKWPLTLPSAHERLDAPLHGFQKPIKRLLQVHGECIRGQFARQDEVEDTAEEEVGCSGMQRSFSRARRASEVARKFAWPRRRRTASEC